jgi:hypothetical protein
VNVALVDFEREYDGKVLRLVAVAIRSPTATSYTDGFPRGNERGKAASRFRSTMLGRPCRTCR